MPRLRFERGDDEQRGNRVGDRLGQVPGGILVRRAKRPALRGEEVDGKQRGREHAEPAATIEQPGQRDHHQPGGLEHEPLLGPVGDHDPVGRQVGRCQSRERPDVRGPAAAERPRHQAPASAAAQNGDEAGVEDRQEDIAERPPVAHGQEVGAQPHRVGAVPARQPDTPQRFQMERIQGIAGPPEILAVPASRPSPGGARQGGSGARVPAVMRCDAARRPAPQPPRSKPPKTIPVGFVPEHPADRQGAEDERGLGWSPRA